MRACLAAVLTSLIATPGWACDLCAIYSATQARGEAGKGFFLGAAEQFTHYGTLQDEGRKVVNETGQYLDSSISQFFVGYNVTERFGVQVNVPAIYRSFLRPKGFTLDQGREAGLGDTSLAGNWIAYRKQTDNFSLRASVLGGLKFPTGSTDRLGEELNEVQIPGAPASGIHGHDLTLGTGSVDGIVGASVNSNWKRVFFTAAGQYAIRTQGDFGYRFANDLTWTAGPGVYALLNEKHTLALQAVVSGEYKGRDTLRGASAEDTGVTAVYFGPQISYSWSGKLSTELGADLPLSIHNTALQAVPDYRIRAGLTWRF